MLVDEDKDEEQLLYTEVYLKKATFDIRTKNMFLRLILGLLLSKEDYYEYRRVILFLQAFSDSMADKLCKKHNIDMEDPETTDNVFAALKRDVLNFCCDDS